jgi:hypothetical protein
MAAIIRASHAISFRLLDRYGQSVLGIFDDQKGQTSTLEIINSSRRNMRLTNLSATQASAAKHHFELKFRPDTLNPKAPKITADAGAAKWVIDGPHPTEGGISYYLLSTNPGVIEAGQSTLVNLAKLNANGTGGARGTRVELKWNKDALEYVAEGTTGPERLVAGHRVKHLDIVNQQGAEYIPLHVSFFGPNQVLNNGVANRLTLRITNELKEGNIQLIPPQDPEFSPSTFIFSFDASDSQDWTLAKVSEVKAINFAATAGGKTFAVVKDELALNAQWIATLPPRDRVTLRPGEFVEVTISNLMTKYQAGPTNLYLRYTNIPGYRDGDFVPIIEKSPLVYAKNGIGVGLTDAQAALDVNGVVRASRQLSVPAGGKVGIGTHDPQDALHLQGNMLFGAMPTQIKALDDKHRLIFGLGEFEIREQNSIVFSPGSDGNTRTAKTVMFGDGRVGIGTPNPEKHLHVSGAQDQEIMIQSTESGGVKWSLQSSSSSGRFEIINRTDNLSFFSIKKDGDVGIATTDPKAKLHVKGDVRIGGDILLENNAPSRIKCFDNNHLIEFTPGYQFFDSKLEIRDTGTIIFSPGAKDGVGTEKVVISPEGRVGIGTTTPWRASLEITNSTQTTVPNYRVMNSGGVGYEPNEKTQPYGIWVNDRIACKEFNAISDGRIKTIQGRSDGAADLSILLGIEITDYSYKDVIASGTGSYKKVIGQQIEKVFPQAVSKTMDVVPDIYEQASIENGWVSLATDLKPGDRVQLITEKGPAVHEVLEVTDDKFRVDFKDEGDTVFVFGREVSDFITVDYDAISMLNVSATQQLKKDMDQEIKSLRVENAELREANESLAKRLQLLESKLEATLGVMAATNGSNGNGRH